MKALIGSGSLALALLLSACGGESGAGGNNSTNAAGGTSAAAVPAPKGGDWTETVSATPEGGFVMGNPNAKVKLVEFASLTCHVCQEFAVNGEADLIEKYVKTGQVSFEIRNFVRDAADLGAALLSRCGGARPYFKLTDQLYAAQDEWIGKLQKMSPEVQQQLSELEPQQQVAAMAQQAGLVDFVRVRGVPTEKAQACLADQKALQQLVDMNQKSTAQYQIQGTPTFLINNEVVQNAANWTALEPELRKALGT
jgi:protein-disulfide isomerase